MSKRKGQTSYSTTGGYGNEYSPDLLVFEEPESPTPPPIMLPGDGLPMAPESDDPYSIPAGIEPARRKRSRSVWLPSATMTLVAAGVLVLLILVVLAAVLVLPTLTSTTLAGASTERPITPVERFVAGFNKGDTLAMEETLDPEARRDLNGILSKISTSVLGVAGSVGVKFSDMTYTEGTREGSVVPVKISGKIEYTAQSPLGEVTFKKSFRGEMSTVARGDHWYIKALSQFSLFEE